MISIRPATPDDAPAWLEMRRALWPEYETNYHPSEVEQYFAGKLSMPLEVLLAIDDKKIAVGFVELNIRPYADDCFTDRVAYLEGWYVAPDARRQGVGRALIAASEQWARKQGCTEFGSDAMLDNTISAAAHQALGFEETVQIRCFRKVLTPEEDRQSKSDTQ